jgi:Protein of unknown function (DUF3810)
MIFSLKLPFNTHTCGYRWNDMGKKKYKWLILLTLVVGIKLFSLSKERVETYYSNGIYPYISKTLRFLLGWLPFSIGDIAYGLAICWLCWKFFKLIKMAVQRKINRTYLWQGFQKTVWLTLMVYACFNVLWGLNYNRVGIASQLGLVMGKYDTNDVKNINALLLQKVNTCSNTLTLNGTAYDSNKELFAKVSEAYQVAQGEHPFLRYEVASQKPSMWGWLGNYTGFTGYYNPFSGEAQVNTTVPGFLLPFTSCHEVGHQLGYAKENEANFAAYLSAKASPDTLFKYSVYLDLFLYANRNLSWVDTAAAKSYMKQLQPAVLQDLEAWRQFNRKHRNPVEPIIRWFYGMYLRSNEQPQGIFSYDAVTSFIIAYYKKFGKV